MDLKRAVLAATIAVIVLVVAAYCWYYATGWTEFSYATGDLPSWAPSGSSGDISRLRFRACKFTVTMPAGASGSADVTAVLNRMAIAYDKATNAPAQLTLVAPLNPFSFAVPGFNDKSATATVPPWCAATTSCGRDSDCPVKGTTTGACSMSAGVCINCTGGPSVALVGKYRTF